MKYVYENMDYEKRGLTDNILLRVIADDYGLVKERSRKYMGAAFSWKAAEMTSQMDACPVTGREEMQKILRIMRAYDPNYRARATQTGTAVSQQAITDVTEEDALFQIANGSIADIAVSYSEEACDTLLSKGILPLTADRPVPVDTYIFVEGIRAALKAGKRELTAYRLTDGMEPFALRLADGAAMEKLEKVFED